MKLKNKSIISLKRLVTLSMALIIALSMITPLTAEAKTKNVSVKNVKYGVSVSTVKKKASKVKIGTTVLTIPKKNSWANGYVKFTAPKSKTYKITISGLKDANGKFCNGHMTVYRVVDSYKGKQYLTSVSTGSNFNLWIASQKSSSRPTTSDKGSIKLKAGESVYMYFSYLGHDKGKISSKLVIK